MAQVFEQKIRRLASALEHEDAGLCETARSTLRTALHHCLDARLTICAPPPSNG
ncbi:MAG: hypothetical protein WBC51_14725 [Vicinamibacterales bacterium]